MSASEPQKRLENWKQIAAYLGKSISAAQRWEKEEGLPVHRHEHQSLASVFAYPEELDAWLESRRKRPKELPAPPVAEAVVAPVATAPANTPLWSRRAWLGAAGTAVAGLGSAAFLKRNHATEGLRSLFIGSANEKTPSVSADGRLILYIESDGQAARIRLYDRQDGTNRVLETLPVQSWACECRLSPNGKTFAFLKLAPRNLWDVHVRDVAGGAVRTIARLDGVGLDWAPDSETLVMTTPSEQGGPLCVWAMRHMIREKRRISSPPPGYWGDIAVATSPDGLHLAVIRYVSRGDGDVWLLSWDRRVERRLTDLHTWINGLTFSSDGREIIFAPVGNDLGLLHRVPVAGGNPSPIPMSGATGVRGLTFPKTGPGFLVFNTTRLLSRVYRGRREGDSIVDPRLTTPINTEGEYITFSHDSKSLAWIQNNGIWMSTDGGPPRLITEVLFDKREMAWSPDRQNLALTVKRDNHWRVWILDVATGSMKRLTADSSTEGRAVWGNSGKYIYWRTERAGDARYFRKSWPEPGEPEPVSGPAAEGFPSFDDRRFYYVENDQKSSLKEIEIGSAAAPRTLAEIPPIEPGHFLVRENSIVYALRRTNSKQTPVFETAIAGGHPQLLFAVPETSDHVSDLAIRPDLHEVAWTVNDDQHDIWIYEAFH
jgi:Tol biopolymer transport system component